MRESALPTQIEDLFIGEHAGARAVTLLQIFPVLARLWSHLINVWANRIIEFLSRLRRDVSAIRQSFFATSNPGALIGVRIDISDPHDGGRETMIVRFEKGCIVYKPRSGQSEAEWFSFIRWINRNGFEPSLRTLRILHRSNYCWEEFVKHESCSSERGAHLYHRRAGGLACAAYLLGAIDCHRDNLIAASDHPVLIDTETLFHPESALALRQKLRGVSRTGFLPISLGVVPSAAGLSALGGSIIGNHVPMLNGKPLATATYSADVLRGFRDMWNLVGESSTDCSASFRRRCSRLAKQHWRRLYFSTRDYLEIRERSLAPKFMRSGVARSRKIVEELTRTAVGARIILKEFSALSRLDIPRFVEKPNGNRGDRLALSDLLSDVSSAFVLT
jgi:lantibiotic modifying enzyme